MLTAIPLRWNRLFCRLAQHALTVYEYAMAIFSKDAEGLKKCNSRLTTRLILIAILVFLPTLINLLLGLLDPSYETCVVG